MAEKAGRGLQKFMKFCEKNSLSALVSDTTESYFRVILYRADEKEMS